jgi:hypothetical protein
VPGHIQIESNAYLNRQFSKLDDMEAAGGRAVTQERAMRRGHVLAMLGLAAVLASPQASCAEAEAGAGVRPKGPLNTMEDVQQAIFACWKWPSGSEADGEMVLTFMLTFKRNGEVLGGRLLHLNRDVSAEERGKYAAALTDAIKLCSPLPIAPGLGEGIAGQPFVFTLRDTRKE